ncbi:hypothetical protein LINGRAHAP2_LOCUS5536 [Linum grandiflorum]
MFRRDLHGNFAWRNRCECVICEGVGGLFACGGLSGASFMLNDGLRGATALPKLVAGL